MDTSKAIGPALKALRKAAGLTQQQLADQARVGFSMISGYERGTEMPQLATLLRLLEAMRLDHFAGVGKMVLFTIHERAAKMNLTDRSRAPVWSSYQLTEAPPKPTAPDCGE